MSNPTKIRSHSITLKANGIARVLTMPITITRVNNTDTKLFVKTNGIWDTGATGTVITQKIVDALGLIPAGKATVNTASETGYKTNVYYIDLFLKNDLRITSVRVTVGRIADDIDCLIGMDIIALGDFSITNYNDATCMSYRIPSHHEIDYVKDPNITCSTPPSMPPKKTQRNEKCPCGSGKKYKYCCSK